ncbi:hypothetical protein [Streptomyces sp. NPDC058583]|uniref:hypothetical protein n=1 Tax=unclassified Streptomyces TaxID=2593676 RepID=UPI00364B0BCD
MHEEGAGAKGVAGVVRVPVEPVEAAREADARDAAMRHSALVVRGPLFRVTMQSKTEPGSGLLGSLSLCETTWQFGTEPCQRCLVAPKPGELFGDAGDVAEELGQFRRALVAAERPPRPWPE